MKDQDSLCPCCSGKPYRDCCQLYHQGKSAPTALALMRSRYAAYAKGLADYIIRTTHPENHDAARPLDERKKDIELFCASTEFKELQILDHGEDTVTFTAHLSQNGKDFTFTEKSAFEKIDGQWLYLSGELSA
jgi:SEC-C motif domain protein